MSPPSAAGESSFSLIPATRPGTSISAAAVSGQGPAGGSDRNAPRPLSTAAVSLLGDLRGRGAPAQDRQCGLHRAECRQEPVVRRSVPPTAVGRLLFQQVRDPPRLPGQPRRRRQDTGRLVQGGADAAPLVLVDPGHQVGGPFVVGCADGVADAHGAASSSGV